MLANLGILGGFILRQTYSEMTHVSCAKALRSFFVTVV